MAKYRKKPIVIDAIQLEDSQVSILKVLRFMGQKVNLNTSIASDRFDDYCSMVSKEGMKINTLEGTMTASIGDYIIKGVNGEFYPCKPDIFQKTYEKVSS